MDDKAAGVTLDTLRKGFQVGPWCVYPDQNLISGVSGEVHLEPRVMEVLVYLAAHQGQVVRRDQLIDSVWNTVVSDEVLSRAVSLLRTSLDDDHKTPRYIQTVPRVGYRFIHPVAELPAAAPADDLEPGESERKPDSRTRNMLLGAGLLIIVALVFMLLPGGNNPDNRNRNANPNDWLATLEARRQEEGQLTSIAVLPFDNLSDENTSLYISDSLTDEVTMSLSKVKGLKVVARRSSYSFKNRLEDVPSIGKLLKVDLILEGSVRKEGEQLRINTQLSSASDGYLLWTQSYSRPLDAVFDLRQEIAAGVVEALQANTELPVAFEVPASSARPPDMEAYRLYMNGRFLWKLRGEQALRESIKLFKQAAALDPLYVRARLALADSLVLLPFYSSESWDPAFDEALKILDQTELEDDWDRGEARAIRGFVAMYRWQWPEAELHFRESIRLAPDNANTYNWYSQFFSMVGRSRDSVTAAERAKELDATSPVVNNRLAVAYLWINDEVSAAEQFAYGSRLGFSNQINPAYIIFLLRQQRFQELELVMDVIHSDPSTRPERLLELGAEAFRPENHQRAIGLVEAEMEQGKMLALPLQMGFWILMEAMDQAFDIFHRFADTPNARHLYPEFMFSREAKKFRQDPRFRNLTRRMGLDTYWSQFGQPDYRKEQDQK